MQQRIERVLKGYDIVSRLKNSENCFPCYICSPFTPKFGQGWEIRLYDGDEIVLIGHDCGKRHLNQAYLVNVRAYEVTEWRDNLLERRGAYIRDADAITIAARNTLADSGVKALVNIKVAVLDLSASARKVIDVAASGGIPSVPALEILQHRHPHGNAREVIKLIDRLKRTEILTEIDKTLKALLREIEEHNEYVAMFRRGISKLTPLNIEKLNAALPEIEMHLRDGVFDIVRSRDGLRRRCPAPSDTNIGPIPIPRRT